MSKNVVSNEKLAANRANATQSTGPRTGEGKARCARNALKHGLLAQCVVVNAGRHSENPDQFNDLLTGFHESLKPRNAFEEALVERIATCFWRLRRAQGFETETLRRLCDAQNSKKTDLRTSLLGIPAEGNLQALIRYETMIDRQFHKAVTEFHRFRVASRNTPSPVESCEPPWEDPMPCEDNNAADTEQTQFEAKHKNDRAGTQAPCTKEADALTSQGPMQKIRTWPTETRSDTFPAPPQPLLPTGIRCRSKSIAQGAAMDFAAKRNRAAQAAVWISTGRTPYPASVSPVRRVDTHSSGCAKHAARNAVPSFPGTRP